MGAVISATMQTAFGIILAQRKFVCDREWEDFQTPKNLAMALGGEVGELAHEISRLFASGGGHPAHRAVADEVGDVALYLLRLHDAAGLDVGQLSFQVADRSRGDSTGEVDKMNLAWSVCQLMSSAGRVLDMFQWQTTDSPQVGGVVPRQNLQCRVDTFVGDFVRICDLLNVDLLAAASAKLEKNERRYPVERSRGSSRKYTEFAGSDA